MTTIVQCFKCKTFCNLIGSYYDEITDHVYCLECRPERSKKVTGVERMFSHDDDAD